MTTYSVLSTRINTGRSTITVARNQIAKVQLVGQNCVGTVRESVNTGPALIPVVSHRGVDQNVTNLTLLQGEWVIDWNGIYTIILFGYGGGQDDDIDALDPYPYRPGNQAPHARIAHPDDINPTNPGDISPEVH